jgi:glutamine phosphoribosylpyrophosphate amidotransferase
MCAIIGSFDIDKLKDLVELNSYRGQQSYSFSEYDPENQQLLMRQKCLGAFSLDNVEVKAGMYYVAHIQAPTTGASAIESIHPSVRNDGNDLLWHNGIIKDYFVKDMQESLQSKEQWDTGLMHDWLINGKSLDEVDGTFACLRYKDGKLYIFRNEISPLFIDDELNISSTKFEGAEQVRENQIWCIDFDNKALFGGPTFITKENPYYFGYVK